jgi:hypothetical protein
VEDDAYSIALGFLLQGGLPVCVAGPEHFHVLSVIPTSRATLAAMINEDERERLRFIVKVVRDVKTSLEAQET